MQLSLQNRTKWLIATAGVGNVWMTEAFLQKRFANIHTGGRNCEEAFKLPQNSDTNTTGANWLALDTWTERKSRPITSIKSRTQCSTSNLSGVYIIQPVGQIGWLNVHIIQPVRAVGTLFNRLYQTVVCPTMCMQSFIRLGPPYDTPTFFTLQIATYHLSV
jgi:hypothetical protein